MLGALFVLPKVPIKMMQVPASCSIKQHLIILRQHRSDACVYPRRHDILPDAIEAVPNRGGSWKQYFGVGFGMVLGVAIGAIAVTGLNAQGKPAVYLVTEIDVAVPDNYAKEFAPMAQATIKAAGGRFVVIGGVAGVGAKPVIGLAGTKANYHSSVG